MKASFLLLMSTIFLAGSVMAETTVGNGGDLVVCRNAQGAIQSTELLDYFEGRELRDLHISLSSAEDALQRLARVSPRRAARYRQLIQNFASNALFKAGVELTDIPDSDHDILPTGCKIEQLAIQRKPVFPEDKLYLINKDLWDVMSPKDRAGLMLHEIIYRDTLDEGRTDSKTARYFNSLISSTEFQAVSIKDYIQVVATVFSPRVAAGEMEPAPGILCDENSNTKLIFVVDTSGSNMSSDPGRQRITDIQGFIRSFAQNAYCRWSVVSFGERVTSHTMDSDSNPIFADGSKIESSLVSLGQTRDSGGTPYLETMNVVRTLLETSSAELALTKVVFISDGVPTDISSNDTILAMVNGFKAEFGGVQFHSVYYGEDSAAAEKLLLNMSQVGGGKYLRSHGPIDFGQILF